MASIAGLLLTAALYSVGAFSLVLIVREELNRRTAKPGIELHEEDW